MIFTFFWFIWNRFPIYEIEECAWSYPNEIMYVSELKSLQIKKIIILPPEYDVTYMAHTNAFELRSSHNNKTLKKNTVLTAYIRYNSCTFHSIVTHQCNT